jgi:hypothetical protein
MYRELALSLFVSVLLAGTASAADPQPGDIVDDESGEMALCGCSDGGWTPEPCMLPGGVFCPPGQGDIIVILDQATKKCRRLDQEKCESRQVFLSGRRDLCDRRTRTH